jgi:hypothetical protein
MEEPKGLLGTFLLDISNTSEGNERKQMNRNTHTKQEEIQLFVVGLWSFSSENSGYYFSSKIISF